MVYGLHAHQEVGLVHCELSLPFEAACLDLDCLVRLSLLAFECPALRNELSWLDVILGFFRFFNEDINLDLY